MAVKVKIVSQGVYPASIENTAYGMHNRIQIVQRGGQDIFTGHDRVDPL
jgi:hypothetical protein